MASFGSRLRELIDKTDMQYKDFANMLKVAPSTISNWLNGDRFPNDERILLFIADYFNITIDYLLGRTDNPNSKVYEANVDGDKIEIEIDKSYPHDLSPDEVRKLIDQLKEVGFDVDKLIDKAKDKTI